MYRVYYCDTLLAAQSTERLAILMAISVYDRIRAEHPGWPEYEMTSDLVNAFRVEHQEGPE